MTQPIEPNPITQAFLNPPDYFKEKIKQLEAKLQEAQEKLACGICYEAERTRIANCGHTFCSGKCSVSLQGKDCPYCKQKITGFKPIYLR